MQQLIAFTPKLTVKANSLVIMKNPDAVNPTVSLTCVLNNWSYKRSKFLSSGTNYIAPGFSNSMALEVGAHKI